MSVKQHKKKAPRRIKTGVLTVSSSRSPASDKSGQWICRRAKKEKHRIVAHEIVADEKQRIRQAVCRVINQHRPHLLILTGGTGIARKDVTIEAVRPLFAKELSGFGAVVAQLNFETIDSAAILSRATAGVIGQTAVFCIPGSKEACKLICRALIFPEAGHMAGHLNE